MGTPQDLTLANAVFVFMKENGVKNTFLSFH